MQEAGLDMAFLLERLFHRNVNDAIDVYVRVCVDSFTRTWAKMTITPVPLVTANGTYL